MTSPVRVPIKREIWNWAIEESQMDVAGLVKRFPKASKWIAEEESPTLKQLEAVANYLKVPLGYMFLNHPPKDDVMDVEFRTISNKLPGISKNLRDTLIEMDRRRSWMSDYRINMGWDKLDFITQFEKHKSGDTVKDASLAKILLHLDDVWYTTVKSLDEAYDLLREKLEDAGILVMKNGVVGQNNYRPLDVGEFRAFMLYDDVSPLIFINNNDSKGGKIFSLVHEYIHVLFEQEDLVLDTHIQEALGNEMHINDLTAEFLMPQAHLYDLWNENKDEFEQIADLSALFKVSRLALAVKLRNMGLVNEEMVGIIRRKSIEDFGRKEARAGGGNYYNTFFSRMSSTFLEAVIRSADVGELGYTYAFKLLGVKGHTYDKIKADVMPYG